MNVSRPFSGHSVVHMPSYLPVLLHVTCPLHSKREARELSLGVRSLGGVREPSRGGVSRMGWAGHFKSSCGWVGLLGLLCGVDLRTTLLNLVDGVSATVHCLRVPRYTDIPGNECADALAKEGRFSSPLYHVLYVLERPIVNLELPSTPTPRRAPALPCSVEIGDVITPCDTPALCRAV